MWVLAAVAIGVVILVVGLRTLNGMARAARPTPSSEATGPEDVEALEVSFVCGECGTELRVARLGEMQVPRHCGEKMLVRRRGTADPGSNGGPGS